MAEIDLERKRRGGAGWLWGLLGLLLLLLIVWWVWPDAEEDEFVGVDPVEQVTPAAGAGAGPEPLSLIVILEDPAQYVDQTFPETPVRVESVPTDRGFWIEEQGQRLFAILQDQPEEQPVNIEPGQMLRISDAMVRDSSYLPQLEDARLDDRTQTILAGEPFFLVVDEENIEILPEGAGAADTATAGSM